MVSLLTQLGFDSFSTLYQPNPSSAAGEQTVTNESIANSTTTPAIDATIDSQPYNFMLGTPGGATDPSAVSDGSDAVYPVDDGEPQYSPSAASTFASLGADGSVDPADLDPSVFDGWSELQQQVYLQSWGLTQAAIGTNDASGGADAIYVSVSSSGSVTTTTLSAWAASQAEAMDSALAPDTAYLQTAYGPQFAADENVSESTAESDLSTAPADLDPSTFESWTSSAQDAYAAYWGILNSTQAVIGLDVDGGLNAIVVTPGPGFTIASTQSLTSWALSQGAALNSAGQATQTVPTSTAPIDLGANGGVDPADLDPSVFEQWTSEQQSEYMNYWGVTTAVIGQDYDGGADAITAVLSSTLPATVYIVQNLQASDLAEMSAADVAAVTATEAWNGPDGNDGVGASLGFTTGDTSSGLTPLQVAQNVIQNAITAMEGTTEYFTITGLSAATETNTTYTAAQVAAGDVVIPTQGSITQDSSGDTILTSVTQNGDGSTTVDQISVNPTTDAGTYNSSTYVTNADGSVTVTETSSTGTGALSSTDPGAPGSTFSVYASVTPTGAGSENVSVTYEGPNSILAYTDTSTMPSVVTVTNTAGGSVLVNGMPAADVQIYIDELQLLEQQVQAAGVVNQTQVATDVTAIQDRFNQAAILYSQYNPSTTPIGNGAVSGAVSTDDNASIQSAYNTLISQEQVILQAAQNSENLSNPSSLDSPDLDAPTAAMIALGTSMDSQEAAIEIGTTQLQQIQTLLQNVGALQNLVNTTVNSLNGSTTGEVALGGFNDGDVTPASDLSSTELAIAQMFSSNIAGANPVLTQNGIQLPQMTLITSSGDMPGYTAEEWTTYGNSLSNLTTQLQQIAQTLMTQLNQETQQMGNTYTEMSGIAGQMGTVIDTIGTNMD